MGATQPSGKPPATESGGKPKKNRSERPIAAIAFVALGAWVVVNALGAPRPPTSAPPANTTIPQTLTRAATPTLTRAPQTPTALPARSPTR